MNGTCNVGGIGRVRMHANRSCSDRQQAPSDSHESPLNNRLKGSIRRQSRIDNAVIPGDDQAAVIAVFEVCEKLAKKLDTALSVDRFMQRSGQSHDGESIDCRSIGDSLGNVFLAGPPCHRALHAA